MALQIKKNILDGWENVEGTPRARKADGRRMPDGEVGDPLGVTVKKIKTKKKMHVGWRLNRTLNRREKRVGSVQSRKATKSPRRRVGVQDDRRGPWGVWKTLLKSPDEGMILPKSLS